METLQSWSYWKKLPAFGTP